LTTADFAAKVRLATKDGISDIYAELPQERVAAFPRRLETAAETFTPQPLP